MTPDANGYSWFDTGISLQPHDVVMVVAHAKWNYRSDINASGWASAYNNEEYATRGDERGNLFFTADGDDLFPNDPTDMLLPKAGSAKNPHCLLVGCVGGLTDVANRENQVFPLGSRGAYFVPTNASRGSLMLAMNDTKGNFGDNRGWCEVWIATYHPE
jgi:hypothetical protein